MDKETPGCLLEIVDQKGTKRIVLKACVLDPSRMTIEVEVDQEEKPFPDLHESMEGRLYLEKESIPVTIKEVLDFPALRLTKVSQRKNVRVDSSLPFTIEKISPHDLPDLLQNGVSKWSIASDSIADRLLMEGQSESAHVYKEIEATSPGLYRVLADLNAKLDLLLCLVANDEYKALLLNPPRRINVSGSGLAFYDDQMYKEGDYILAKIVLPLSPLAFIELLGEVVSCSVSDQPPEGQQMYRVAVNFLSISEDSREKVIRYVFQEQRKTLRERTDSSMTI
ncbi:MAG: PilZ domain-containing protein [Desulfatiglandales bacterium]